MRHIKIGKHQLPLWILVTALTGFCLVAYASYQVLTIFISVEVKEPLEMVSYPSKISLYPGESKEFNVTIRNNASVNYSVSLVCSMDNHTYQEQYVTFDDVEYDIVPGQQQLTVWLEVKSNASPATITLTVDLKRMEEGP